MAEDGTWTAPVSLPATGRYRVITEFVAEDDGGNGDHVIFGETLDVTEGADVELPPADTAMEVEVIEDGSSLEFHTEIEDAGDYQLFVQVRVDGFLHTVPVDATVGAAAA